MNCKFTHLYALAAVSILFACRGETPLFPEKQLPGWKAGLLKSVELRNMPGQTERYEFDYSRSTTDSAILVSEFKRSRTADRFAEVRTFVRDAYGVPVESPVKLTQGDSVRNYTLQYVFRDNKIAQANEIAATYSLRTFYSYENGYISDITGAHYDQKKSTQITTYKVRFQWVNGSLVTMIPITPISKYEEIDFVYTAYDNPLYQTYKNHMGFGGDFLDAIVPKLIASYEHVFEGSVYTYEYVRDNDGKVIKRIRYNTSSGKAIAEGETIYEYYE
jgi:hypothetical protein